MGDSDTRRELTNASDLNFGIGTVFITDPEGNVIEFMQADRGVFAKYHFPGRQVRSVTLRPAG